MGLLDALRPPKEPHVALARRLGRQLERISPSNLRDPPRGEESVRLVDELDAMLARAFHEGSAVLIDRAVLEWSTRVASPDAVRVAARWFREGSWYDQFFGRLPERRKDAGPGLIWLKDALISADILPGPPPAERLSAPRPDPKSLVGLMADVVLPEGADEEWLLAKLKRFTGEYAGGSLLAVRIAALRLAALSRFADRDVECQRLVDAVIGKVLDRRQWKDPRDLVERVLLERSETYLYPQPVKGWETEDIDEVFAAVMGATFAAECETTDRRAKRLGGEEYNVALHRLHQLAQVAAEGPFMAFLA